MVESGLGLPLETGPLKACPLNFLDQNLGPFTTPSGDTRDALTHE